MSRVDCQPETKSGAVDDPRDELRFILLARWAVQILDAWAEQRQQVTPTVSPTKWPFDERGAYWVLVRKPGGFDRFFGATRDAARINAARALANHIDPVLRDNIEDPPS